MTADGIIKIQGRKNGAGRTLRWRPHLQAACLLVAGAAGESWPGLLGAGQQGDHVHHTRGQLTRSHPRGLPTDQYRGHQDTQLDAETVSVGYCFP